MHDHRFDDLAQALSYPAAPRRHVLTALLAAALGAAAVSRGESEALAGNRGRRRKRRRRRQQSSHVCFKGRTLVVDRAAARELVSRGGTLGRCRPAGEPGEPQACAGALPFCSANPNACGPAQSNCVCLATTIGDSVCAQNQSVCEAEESTCANDQDCVDRYGAGFACVSTTACGGLHCGGNGNACVPPCAPCIPTGSPCGAGVSGSCCEGASCNDGVCGGAGIPGPASCSEADPTCPPCQVCVENSICQPVPNGLLACDGSFLRPQSECTQQPSTGVCQDGECYCGPSGEYNRSTNTCACNAESREQCRNCCQLSFVCADGTSLATCGVCAPG